jgi:hypothetical protein
MRLCSWKFSSDIRACSTVLYIIAERWQAARKVRNAFESLVSATIEAGESARQSRRTNSFASASTVIGHTKSTMNTGTGELQHVAHADDSLGYSADSTAIDVWDLLGTVLDDKENCWRWAQEGFYNAMGAFPEYGYTL